MRNAVHEWVPCDCPAGKMYRAEPPLELQLAKCRKELAATRERLDPLRNRDLESDSIVASCSCMTKTNEAHYHKPGCKYRLITERDEAREESAKFKAAYEESLGYQNTFAKDLELLYCRLGFKRELYGDVSGDDITEMCVQKIRDFVAQEGELTEAREELAAARRYESFGRDVWKWIEDQGGEFCATEICEELLPMALSAGLCQRVPYDPDKHGDIEDADPGDEIWWLVPKGKEAKP